jgi:predicted cobalt transporter CbtA
LRFLRRNEDQLWLMYGQDRLAAPRYDLALLAPRVLGARVPEVGLSEAEEELTSVAGSRVGTIVFWCALVLVLVVLFGLVARLLRRGPDDE